MKAVISEVLIKKEGGGAKANHGNGGGSSIGNDDSGIDSLESSGAGGGMMGTVLQNISNVIANVGSALMENMKAEQDMRLVQTLDTPIGRHLRKSRWL